MPTHILYYGGVSISYYEKYGENVVCIDNEIPFEIPDNWCWCRLTAISNITMGSSPKSENINRNKNFIEFHQGKIHFSSMYLNRAEQYTMEITKIAPKDSVLLCVRAPVGEVNITNREICIGRGLSAIHPLDAIQTKFLFYWLKNYKSSLLNESTGSTFSAITADTVKNILIPIPSLSEQNRIVAVIESIHKILNNAEASLN